MGKICAKINGSGPEIAGRLQEGALPQTSDRYRDAASDRLLEADKNLHRTNDRQIRPEGGDDSNSSRKTS